MKKIEALGKVVSRNELKQINGGVGTLYLCSCFGGEFGSPPMSTFMSYTIDYGRCPSGASRIVCNPVNPE